MHGSQVVHPCADDYVFVPQGLVASLDKSYHVAGCQCVSVRLQDAERIPVLAGQDIHSVFLQDSGHIFSCHGLSFGSGLTAFHYRCGDGGNVLLERADRLTVVESGIGSVLELR